jgi:hypothetical protein
MWVANLYNDKGASLATYITKKNYKDLPNCICVENKIKTLKLGNLCPKLRAIILNFRIELKENPNLREVLSLKKT